MLWQYLDSNTASVKDRFRPGNDIYGIAPKTVTNIETSVTIRKPSLFDRFLFDLREINQSKKPHKNVTVNLNTNG